MAKDRLLELTNRGDNTFVTKTAPFTGDLRAEIGSVQPSQVMHVRLVYKNALTTGGTGSATFTLEESNDGTTWNNNVQNTVNLTTTAGENILDIPFATKKRFVRLSLTAISGTGATITYSAGVASTGN